MMPNQNSTQQNLDALVQSRLAAIVTSSADAIIGETLDGIITDWNPAAERLYGYTAEEAIGQHLSLLVPADLAQEPGHLLARVCAGESVEGIETVRRTKDGRRIAVSLTVSPVWNEAGQIIAASGISRDISERKDAEAAGEQHTRYMMLRADISRALAESSPLDDILQRCAEVLVACLDAAFARIWLVDEGGRMLELRASAGLYTHLNGAHSRIPIGTLKIGRIAAGRQPHLTNDVPNDPHIGDRGWAVREGLVAFAGHPLLVENRLVGVMALFARRPLQEDALEALALVTDVLAQGIERKRTEEALHRSEARFRSLISNSTDIITILDADGVIHFESPPIERILGYDRNELLGRNAFDLVHPDDHAAIQAVFEDALADPVVVPTVEFRCLHADGSWRWLESTGTNLLADPNVGGFVVNSRDVTERKRSNEELRAALHAAQAANHAKGIFLDMMSHELRTPLQAVLGYSESLLAAPKESLTCEQREDIGYIHQAGERMIALINQLLDLSRMEAGRLELTAEPVNLAQVIEQVRQDVAPQAAAKSLGVQIELPQVLPAVVGDAERVRQILLNLTGNAVKFTNQGCIFVTAIPSGSGGVEVSVSDTGIGIAADALPNIFDEFHQGDSSLTRRHEGAGLGLAIARNLAEQMGGSISVTSQPGVGSTFRLHLPGSQL